MAFPLSKGQCRIHAHRDSPLSRDVPRWLGEGAVGHSTFHRKKDLADLLSGHMRGGGLFLSGAAWASGVFVPTTGKISPGRLSCLLQEERACQRPRYRVHL